MKNTNLKFIYQALFYLSFLCLCACVTPNITTHENEIWPLSKVTKKDRNREISILLIDTIDIKKLKYLKKVQGYSCSKNYRRASVKAAIEMLSQLDSVPHLVIRRLDSIPSNIVKLKGLLNLSLVDANMEDLPESICQFDKLNSLMVGYSFSTHSGIHGDYYYCEHKINKLPNSFSKLTNLEYLTLSGTAITTFPMLLCDFKKLIYLNISDTAMDSIPDCICNTKKTIESYQSNLFEKLPCKSSIEH